MNYCLVLVLALLVAGCRCEKPPSRAEVLFFASMEPGATKLTPSQFVEFQRSLTRLSHSQLAELFLELDVVNPSNGESSVSASGIKAANMMADEILDRDPDFDSLLQFVGEGGRYDMRNRIFLRRLGEMNPDRGWLFLMNYYRMLERLNPNYSHAGFQISIPFFQAVQEYHPELARQYLREIVVRKSSDFSPFYEIRFDGVAACFSACSSTDEVISFIEWAIEIGIGQYWVSNYDGSFYLTLDQDCLGAVTRGIFVLARMEPLAAQKWIKENGDDLPVGWGVAFVAGAVEYSPVVKEGNPRYENRYEEAMEFVARQTSPGSEVFTKLVEGSFSPEPGLKARLLEVQKGAK